MIAPIELLFKVSLGRQFHSPSTYVRFGSSVLDHGAALSVVPTAAFSFPRHALASTPASIAPLLEAELEALELELPPLDDELALPLEVLETLPELLVLAAPELEVEAVAPELDPDTPELEATWPLDEAPSLLRLGKVMPQASKQTTPEANASGRTNFRIHAQYHPKAALTPLMLHEHPSEQGRCGLGFWLL
jgi:hypothetical protein